MSEESTEWEAPSLMTTFTPVTGNSILGPLARHDRKPFSQAAMNCVGIAPPTTWFSKTKSSSATGSIQPATRPYWPEPPVCFLWV